MSKNIYDLAARLTRKDPSIQAETIIATLSRRVIDRDNRVVIDPDATGVRQANASFTVTVANVDPADGSALVTIQSSAPGRSVLTVWSSATAYGAPTDLGDVTAVTGSILNEPITDALLTVGTDANGTATLNYNLAADGPLHIMVDVGGRGFTASGEITGN